MTNYKITDSQGLVTNICQIVHSANMIQCRISYLYFRHKNGTWSFVKWFAKIKICKNKCLLNNWVNEWLCYPFWTQKFHEVNKEKKYLCLLTYLLCYTEGFRANSNLIDNVLYIMNSKYPGHKYLLLHSTHLKISRNIFHAFKTIKQKNIFMCLYTVLFSHTNP